MNYSRILSYLVKIYSNRNNSTGESKGYTMSVFTDYVDSKENSSNYTNYFHGNNIGFLAGHVDGTMTNSYVYDSMINLNQGDTIVDPILNKIQVISKDFSNNILRISVKSKSGQYTFNFKRV